MVRQPRSKTRTTKSPKGAKPRRAPAKAKAAPREATAYPAAVTKRPAKRSTVRAARRTPTFAKSRSKPTAALQAALSSPAPHGASPQARAVAASISAQLDRQSTAAPSSTGAAALASAFSIPTGYGDHKIVLMVKDPWWIYAYWETQPEQERQVRRQLRPEEVSGLRAVLRVYDVTGRNYPDEGANRWFDITVSDLAMNWFIHVNAPNRSFIVELGLLTAQGRFLMLVRSNRVTTPRFGPSDVLDEAWMVTDEAYWRLFGMTAGVGLGSSAGLKHALARHMSSAGMWSPLFGPAEAPKTAPNT